MNLVACDSPFVLRTNGGVEPLSKERVYRKVRGMSTVLAQDHFYSDFLSLSLTTLTHKGSAMMTQICSGLKRALAYVTGGMSSNNHSRSVERINRTQCSLLNSSSSFSVSLSCSRGLPFPRAGSNCWCARVQKMSGKISQSYVISRALMWECWTAALSIPELSWTGNGHCKATAPLCDKFAL